MRSADSAVERAVEPVVVGRRKPEDGDRTAVEGLRGGRVGRDVEQVWNCKVVAFDPVRRGGSVGLKAIRRAHDARARGGNRPWWN